jgi:protein-disulfide isomerase
MTGSEPAASRKGFATLIENVAGNRRKNLLAGLIGVLVGGAAVALWSGQGGAAGPGQAHTEAIVRNYILSHPEIIPEAMQRLQERDVARAIEARRAEFETPFAGAWAGAADADVVLVEFFDYACGFCRKSNADVDRLLREDPKLKVVWRELPVLGPESQAAAEVSLAAARQGRFRAFHQILFSLGPPRPASVARAQQAAGISAGQVAAMRGSATARREVDRNYALAQAVSTSGTPTFVVGDKVLQGAVGYAALKAAIAEARARG